jgi:hypothetical protein
MTMSRNHGFDLQHMLGGVFTEARHRMATKLAQAEDEEKKDEGLPPFLKKDEKKDEGEKKEEAKSASFNYAYINKLANAVEMAVQRLPELVDHRSNEEKVAEALLVAEAMGFRKVAVEGPPLADSGNAPVSLTPPTDPPMGQGLQTTGTAPANAMQNTADAPPGGGGTQPYKHDKATTTTIPTETPLTNPALATGESTTAMETDDNKAPGNNAGPVPTSSYPDEGVIREKGAALMAQGVPPKFARVLTKTALPIIGAGYGAITAPEGRRFEGAARGALGETIGGAGGAVLGVGAGAGAGLLASLVSRGKITPAEAAQIGGAVGTGIGGLGGSLYGIGRATRPTREALAAEKGASLKGMSPVVDFVLRKMAEDAINPASISAGPVSTTTVEGGTFPGTQAEEGVPAEQKPPQASHVDSSQAAIDMTKRDAAASVKQDLGKVLDEPAQSQASDSKLQENLTATDAAGAKIAGRDVKYAAARELLRRVLSGEQGKQKEAALKTALQKLAEEGGVPLDPELSVAPMAEEENRQEEERLRRLEEDFAELLAAAAQAQGEGGSTAPAAPTSPEGMV